MSESDGEERPERAAPHDALFKLAFGRPENASGLLRTLLPADACAQIDFATLELVPGSFQDVELRDVETDLLFRVDLGGEPAFIYALLEHQSRVDTLMGWRLLRYMVRIWEGWTRDHPGATKLPAILPLVVAHGNPWTAPTSFVELLSVSEPMRDVLAPLLVNFRYFVDDLAAQSTEALCERRDASPMARLTLFLLKRARSSADLLEELRPWAAFLDQGRGVGRDDLLAIVMYSWVVAEVTPAKWRAFLQDELNLDPEAVMSAAEKMMAQIGPPKWMAQGREKGLAEGREKGLAEGREKGLAEGREKGLAEGQVQLILLQLGKRFGPLSVAVEERVRAAPVDELNAMAARILDAEDLAGVLGD